MEEFLSKILGFAFVFSIALFFFNYFLFKKFGFPLFERLGLYLYVDDVSLISNAIDLFERYPTQHKVDIMIRHNYLKQRARLTSASLGDDAVFCDVPGEHLAIVNEIHSVITLILDPKEWKSGSSINFWPFEGEVNSTRVMQHHTRKIGSMRYRSWVTLDRPEYNFLKYAFGSDEKNGRTMCHALIQAGRK